MKPVYSSKSTATTIVVVPTFNLRGIKFVDLYNAYKRGDYNKLKLPESKVKDANVSSLAATVYSTSEAEGIYTKTNRDGSTIIRVTTDQKSFEIFNKTGSLPEKGMCDNCRRIKSNLMVCPTSIYSIEGLEETIGNTDSKNAKYIVYGPTLQCSFRCALTYARLYSKVDHQFSNSEEIIKFIFHLIYPGKTLEPAPDYKLLVSNGGSITDDEYDNPKYQYTKVVSVIMAPLKMEYTRTITS
jgi:hypothetical protein